MQTIPIETHPFPPFTPADAKILIMGTFPPKSSRWSMEFYYPNRINDFWRIMGLIFFKDPDYLCDNTNKTFKLDLIKELLTRRGIALSDTGHQAKRLKDNASDKFLEIVTPVDLHLLLERMPLCRALATTGEKAGDTLATITGIEAPKIGQFNHGILPDGREIDVYRMPSTSRAYPLPLAQKAAYYADMFRHVGILD